VIFVKKSEKLDLVQQFGNLWRENILLEDKNEEIPENKRKVYLNKGATVGIVPKKKWVNDVLTRFFDISEGKEPLKLNYLADKEELIRSRYSTELLKIALEMARHYETVDFYMRKDYPLTVSCKDFDFILAPREIVD